jgi:bacterial/archaeal transporter family-2 protein
VQTLPYLLSALALGVLVAMQPLMNAVLARAIGSAYAAAGISILVAALGAVLMVLVSGRGELSRAALGSVPWWIYLAGFIGTLFVAGGVVIAPVTGALVFVICVVAGQLLGATVADHFGLFGIEVRSVTPLRLLGLALVAAGAALAQRG